MRITAIPNFFFPIFSLLHSFLPINTHHTFLIPHTVYLQRIIPFRKLTILKLNIHVASCIILLHRLTWVHLL